MSNKSRLEKLEDKLTAGDEPIKEITINIVKADGTPGGTIVSKQVNGVWSNYEKQT